MTTSSTNDIYVLRANFHEDRIK